jgi:hypothetical protein
VGGMGSYALRVRLRDRSSPGLPFGFRAVGVRSHGFERSPDGALCSISYGYDCSGLGLGRGLAPGGIVTYG